MENTIKQNDFLTIKQVCQILRVSDSTLRRYIKANKIQITQADKGKKIMINSDDLIDFILNNNK